jgi:hypothetical protein
MTRVMVMIWAVLGVVGAVLLGRGNEEGMRRE